MTAFVCVLDLDGDVRLETNGCESAKTNLACHRPQGLRFLQRKWLYFETGDSPSQLAKSDDLDRHHMHGACRPGWLSSLPWRGFIISSESPPRYNNSLPYQPFTNKREANPAAKGILAQYSCLR